MPNAAAVSPLASRYGPQAVEVFSTEERARFLDEHGRPRDSEQLSWELLYRLEPDLYARLVEGETLHPGIVAWLPRDCGRVLEVGAGTGRLTLAIASRCQELIAVEPAAPLRHALRKAVVAGGYSNVEVKPGFFDELPVDEKSCDLVISCSAFSPQSTAEPERSLHEMERRCISGGMLVLVWPNGLEWLTSHGFQHVTFEGPMAAQYDSAAEALTMSQIFYPHAVPEVARRRSARVEYEVLGINAPRDLCWKRCS